MRECSVCGPHLIDSMLGMRKMRPCGDSHKISSLVTDGAKTRPRSVETSVLFMHSPQEESHTTFSSVQSRERKYCRSREGYGCDWGRLRGRHGD